MRRIGTSTGLFKDINPFTNTGGTTITSAWLNSVQEELCNLIISSGLTLNPDSTTQLTDALNVIIKSKAVNADWNATYGGAQILNKPTTFTPSVHSHNAADILTDSSHRFVTDAEKSILSSGGFETSGTAANLILEHENKEDPHPVYLLSSELATVLSGYSLVNHTHAGLFEPANSNIQNHISSTSNPHNTTASQIAFTSIGNILSTDVQAAIAELDTEKQPLDATLTALAGVSTSADKLIYATGSDTFSTTTITSAARAILDDSTVSAMRTTLGLGTIATQESSSVSISGGSISGITDLAVADGGTGASDPATARTNLGAAATGGKLSQFAATTSAELAGVISDETGSGRLVFATSPTLITPVLGTPTSGTLTNCVGLPISTGISGLGTNVSTFLATPSSSNLLSVITDETGTGNLVFNTSPTFIGSPYSPQLRVGESTTYGWSGVSAVDVSTKGAIIGTTGSVGLSYNTYYDGTVYRYKTTDTINQLYQSATGMFFRTLASGNAGDAVGTWKNIFGIGLNGYNCSVFGTNTLIDTVNALQVLGGMTVQGATEDNQTIGSAVTSRLKITNTYVSGFGRLSELQFASAGSNSNQILSCISSAYINYNASNGLGGDLRFSTKNSATDTAPLERIRITSAGRVLIGTTSDDGSSMLQIAGNVSITGTLKADTSSGTSNSIPVVAKSDSSTMSLYAFGSAATGEWTGRSGIYMSTSSTNSSFTIWQGSAPRLHVAHSTGNVILSNAPVDDNTNKLQVVGSAKIQSGATSLLIGADASTTTLTDATTKGARLAMPHYTTVEEPIGLIYSYSNATDNVIYIGGGTSGCNAATKLVFITAVNTTTTTGVEAARVTPNQNFLVGTTTENTTTGNAKIQSSNGIYLGNSANSAANVLDWYEEGTFTPVVVGTTTAGTGTYTTQKGKYTRIGNVVVYAIDLSWTAHDGTGDMQISGLPFISASDITIPAAVSSGSLIIGAGKQLEAIVVANGTTIRLRAMDVSGGAFSSIAMDSVVVALRISGHYMV